MRILRTIEDVKAYVRHVQGEGKTIGFVPTMGYLHQGHLALMKRAKIENDCLIASVYVNPTQFGPNEDFDAYPRNEEGDAQLMVEVGVDACFFPTNDQMYPQGYMTYIENQGDLVNRLCGAKREGHFKGVTTIVGKLFNLVKPNRAYFGQKDAQQVTVIKRMVADLNFDVTIVSCDIVREPDGLAMSSRNKYLSEEARVQALALKGSLDIAQALIHEGQRQVSDIKTAMTNHISQFDLAKIDYIEFVDNDSLQPVDTLNQTTLIALAVYIDKTRLIDNMIVEV